MTGDYSARFGKRAVIKITFGFRTGRIIRTVDYLPVDFRKMSIHKKMEVAITEIR